MCFSSGVKLRLSKGVILCDDCFKKENAKN